MLVLCALRCVRRKAVLPLSLVMFFSCGVNIFPVEDLANRMSMATTMFLAAFATLYVVGNELPKTWEARTFP